MLRSYTGQPLFVKLYYTVVRAKYDNRAHDAKIFLIDKEMDTVTGVLTEPDLRVDSRAPTK